MRPFNVRRVRLLHGGWSTWFVWNRRSGRAHGPFDTQAEAIDFCYKTWPWYP